MDSALAILVGPPAGWAIAAVWGALWGSFANVAIHRIGQATVDEEEAWVARPESARPSFLDEEREHWRWIGRALRSLVSPSRSHCPRCGAAIRAVDNVPVVSWLLLGGKCRACKAPIRARYPLVELASIGLAVAVYARFVAAAPAAPLLEAARFFVYYAFAAVLLVLTAIDLDTMFLPDAITYPAIPLFFACARLLPDVDLVSGALGCAIGYGGLRAIGLGWRVATGREGMGGGDAKLLALVGGVLGWHALPFTLCAAAILGLFVSVPLLLVERGRARRDSPSETSAAAEKSTHPHVHQGDAAIAHEPLPAVEGAPEDPSLTRTAIPFGPYLCGAALAYLFFGPTLHRLLWTVLAPAE